MWIVAFVPLFCMWLLSIVDDFITGWLVLKACNCFWELSGLFSLVLHVILPVEQFSVILAKRIKRRERVCDFGTCSVEQFSCLMGDYSVVISKHGHLQFFFLEWLFSHHLISIGTRAMACWHHSQLDGRALNPILLSLRDQR